jgi:hypothetical protein
MEHPSAFWLVCRLKLMDWLEAQLEAVPAPTVSVQVIARNDIQCCDVVGALSVFWHLFNYVCKTYHMFSWFMTFYHKFQLFFHFFSVAQPSMIQPSSTAPREFYDNLWHLAGVTDETKRRRVK